MALRDIPGVKRNIVFPRSFMIPQRNVCHISWRHIFCRVRVAQSSVYLWSLHCLFFFDVWLLFTLCFLHLYKSKNQSSSDGSASSDHFEFQKQVSTTSMCWRKSVFLHVLMIPPTNKTDRHDITEIVLKVVLNTITLTPVMTKTIDALMCTWSRF